MVTEKLTKEALKKQVARLKTLPRGEERPWGSASELGLRDELLKALWEQACSDQHAELIVDQIIRVSKFCPSPAELIEIADSVPEYAKKQTKDDYKVPGPTRCVACDDSGFKRKTFERDGEKYDFAVPCGCRGSKPVERAAAQ